MEADGSGVYPVATFRNRVFREGETGSVGFRQRFGTEVNNGGFDDSTAILAGTWGPTQTVSAVVRIVSADSGDFEEVELRLRSAISAHSCTGYELNFSVKAGNPYAQIVRWNGALGDFTLLDARTVAPITNGTIVKGTITNNTITTYINGVAIFSVTDSTFPTGSPGVGFYLSGSGNNANYGFSSFTATDGATSAPVAGFAGSPTNGTAPLVVSFTNLSTGATNYVWTFGDGHTSTNTNPANIYTNPGSYSVSLTAIGAGGTNTLSLSNYIVVAATPPAVFLSALVTNGQFNLSFDTVTAQSYTIQQNTDLPTTNWVTVTNFLGTGSPCQFTTPASNTGSPVFFRVREP
jgi:PKD repeat protein